MPDLYTRRATFTQVQGDPKAIEFHASKYLSGMRYPLALQCYQYLKLQELKPKDK